jgi:hypothetical protein
MTIKSYNEHDLLVTGCFICEAIDDFEKYLAINNQKILTSEKFSNIIVLRDRFRSIINRKV